MKVAPSSSSTPHARPPAVAAPSLDVHEGAVKLRPESGLLFELYERPHRLFYASLVGLVGTALIFAVAGAYGLASNVIGIPVVHFVSSVLLGQGLFTLLVAGFGMFAARIHHNFFLGVFFSVLCVHIVLECAVALYALATAVNLDAFAHGVLLPQWSRRASLIQSEYACTGFDACVTAAAAHWRPRLALGVAVGLLLGLLQAAGALLAWAVRRQVVRMMENAPLVIAADPLALDEGDLALSDVWSDAPMGPSAVARRLFAVRSRVGAAVRYAVPLEQGGGELWERLPEPRAAAVALDAARPVQGAAAALGAHRLLVRSRTEARTRNPLLDSEEEDGGGFSSMSDRARHTRVLYRFGY